MSTQLKAVGGNNSRRLLPAMLQSMQSQVSKRLRFWVRVDRDYAAFVVKFIRSHKFVLTHCKLRNQFRIRFQRSLNRALKSIPQLAHRSRHYYSSIQPDFNFVGNGLPDNIGREAIFYCQLLDSREVTLVARDDYPARVLAEQNELGSQSVRH